MHIVFIEYAIAPAHMETYRAWIRERKERTQRFHIYEGTDQPGLFVEVWEASDETAAEAVKKERCDERSSWSAMSAWLPEGKRLHAWVFRPL